MGAFMDYFFGTKGKKSEDEETKKAVPITPTVPQPKESTVDEDIQNIENRRKKVLEKTKKVF